MQMQLASPTPSITSSIDPTTGEDIHMNMRDLQGTQVSHPTTPLKVPNHLPLHQPHQEANTKKNCTPPSPSSSQGSPVTQKPRKRVFGGPKLITGRQRRTQTPEIPSRTTSRTASCVMGETSPPVTKQFSMSTGNLRDPSPTFFNNRLSGHSSGNNSPDVPISAKQLPLPNPPLPFFPGGRNSPHLHHPKPPSIDENSVYNAGSSSSLASQSPTLSTPPSLSDEETRSLCNTNSNHGSPKEHIRSTSDVGVSYRGPYQRSTSLPSEAEPNPKPPSIAGHYPANTGANIPQYINLMGNSDPVYINVSKRDDVYENPPMFHEEYDPQNALPPIPPKGHPPW